MKLNEAEMRMAYQIESTSQNAALHEIYVTWRYSQNQAKGFIRIRNHAKVLAGNLRYDHKDREL